jgi:hypothetical protein
MGMNDWNPDMKLFHRFRGKGKQILGITDIGDGLIVLLERGPYWFPSLNSKPRKIKDCEL